MKEPLLLKVERASRSGRVILIKCWCTNLVIGCLHIVECTIDKLSM